MKKNVLLSIVLALVTIFVVVVLVSCTGGGSSIDCVHEWNELSRQDAGCEKPGVLERECVKCGQRDNQHLDPIGHTIVENKGYAATCTEPGLSDGTYCEMCKYEFQPRSEISPKGHNYQTVFGYKATCFENGLTDGEACADCGEVFVEQNVIFATGHDWVTDYGYYATCEGEGLTAGSHCYLCGEIGEEQEVIPPLGHYFVSAGIRESTCTQPGYSYGTYCSNCYTQGESERELPLADHTPVVDEGYLPTCTKNGLTEGSHCSYCEAVIDEQKIIDYLGHKIVSFGGTDATCEKVGKSEGLKCEECGYIIKNSVSIPKEKHTFENGTCKGCALTASSGLSYEKNSTGNGYIVIGKGDFSGNELVVPDVYEGLPVLAIGENAFKNENLTSVILAGDTVAIERGAFEGCTQLTEVKLPKSVVEINENAFDGCTSLEYVDCEDFAQSYEWSKSWSGDEDILIKSEQKDGLTAFEIYLLAMEAMQKNIDRFIMDVNQKTDVYLNGMLYQSATNEQYYECVLDDVYSYQNDGQAEMWVWYVDEIAYLVQNGAYYKMEASPEYFRDFSNQMMETLNVFEEKYFDNAEFYRNSDGTYTLVLVMSNENMADLVERVLGITDNSVTMTSCIYSYDFDSNGYLASMYADAEFSMSAGEYIASGMLDQDVVLKEVGTLQSVTQPQGSFIDITNRNCTHPNPKRVTVKGFDATCTMDGITDGIYCSDCYATIKSSEIIEAKGHSYENGKCTACGILENQSTGLYYEISEDGRTVYLAGVGAFDGTNVVIPETVFGVPVVGIKADAFDGAKITSIVLPKTITVIEKGALDSLKNVSCSTSVVKLLPSNIEVLTLTEGTIITKDDFANLTELKMITLSQAIESLEIADGAFENCTKLYIICNYSSLEITEGDETANGGIAKYARMVNERIEDDGKYTLIGDFMFYQNGSDGYILSMWFGTGDTLVLPDSINGEIYTISRYVFENNTDIVSLTIPVGIKIERYAFSGCTSIKYLTAESDNISTVPKDSLTDIVVLGEAITIYSLSGIKNLSSITISSSIKSIETGFNSVLSEDSKVYYLGTLEDWCKIEFKYYESNPMNRTENVYIDGEIITNLVIPESITEIKDFAFYSCKTLVGVIIPNNVTTIGKQAFCECDALTGVTIGESVINIGEGAFKYCTAITEINFNATAVQDLSDYSETFGNAGKQAAGINVTFGKNVTRIPASLFYVPSYYNTSSANIVSVTFEDGSVCQSIGNTAFANCKTLSGSLIIPNGVTSIGEYAFSECEELTSITIPNTVTSIGEEAFYSCYKIENATMPTIAIPFIAKTVLKSVVINGGTEIPDKAFYNCYALTSVELPDSITSIGEYAFYYCKITSIEIPSEVTSIGKYAFGYCSKLTSATFVNTSGWYITETKGALSGTEVDVTDAAANATMLKTYTSDYNYWYKK